MVSSVDFFPAHLKEWLTIIGVVSSAEGSPLPSSSMPAKDHSSKTQSTQISLLITSIASYEAPGRRLIPRQKLSYQAFPSSLSGPMSPPKQKLAEGRQDIPYTTLVLFNASTLATLQGSAIAMLPQSPEST